MEGAPRRGNKRIAQGRAKRHPGYETHTKTRPTGAKAFCTRQRETMSHGYIRFCPCRANSLSFLFSGSCPGLCAFASPRRLSIRHILLRAMRSLGFPAVPVSLQMSDEPVIHNSQFIIHNSQFIIGLLVFNS